MRNVDAVLLQVAIELVGQKRSQFPSRKDVERGKKCSGKELSQQFGIIRMKKESPPSDENVGAGSSVKGRRIRHCMVTRSEGALRRRVEVTEDGVKVCTIKEELRVDQGSNWRRGVAAAWRARSRPRRLDAEFATLANCSPEVQSGVMIC